jgi:anti-sigma-K factor RskA
MAAELSHAEIQELLGAYALNAVSAEEAAAVEAHLPGCPRCRAEVDEHVETAAMLAGTGPGAPDSLWGRIDAALEEAPPGLDVTRLRPRRRPARWVAAAAAAAAAVALGVMSVRVMEQGDRLDRLEADQRLVAAAAAAAADPSSERVELRSEDGRLSVAAVVLPDGRGYLINQDLRPLPEGRTYQLWMLEEDVPVSAGILGPNPSVAAFEVTPEAGALAITEERAGGAPKDQPPNLPPVVVGSLTHA